MAEPDCPKCPFSPMDVLDLGGGVQVDECPRCKGRWYDYDELAKCVKDRSRLEAALAKGPIRPRPGSAKCPRCLADMQNGGLGGEFLRVDQCSAHGIWLDESEVRLIDKALDAL